MHNQFSLMRTVRQRIVKNTIVVFEWGEKKMAPGAVKMDVEYRLYGVIRFNDAKLCYSTFV